MLEEALQELVGEGGMEEVEDLEAVAVRVGLEVMAAMVAHPKLYNTEVCCFPSLYHIFLILGIRSH